MWVDSAEGPGKAHRVGRGKWETRAQGDLLIQGVRNGDEGGERPKGREGADGQQPQNSDHIFGIEVITISSFQINDPKKWNKACPWPNLGWIYYSHFFLQRKLIYLIDLWFFFSTSTVTNKILPQIQTKPLLLGFTELSTSWTWVPHWYQEHKETKQRSLPSRSLDAVEGPSSLTSLLPPLAHIHTQPTW